MATIELTDNSAGLTDTPGFAVAAVSCDIRGKGDGRLDLALVHSRHPATAAGVFTRNTVCAAPVKVCREILASGNKLHGVVINSGNANACTGEQGLVDARAMHRLAEEQCDCPTGSMLVCSTGRIGSALPMPAISDGISTAATRLSTEPAAAQDAAKAILTSDTRPKTVTARFVVDNKTVTVSAMAKGAGMIEPNMATMLAFLATDAEVPTTVLQTILAAATAHSFNCISVDGDMSTNDTVLLFANGQSGVRCDNPDDASTQLLAEAVQAVCMNLAEKIVGDGEKITKIVRVRAEGAPSTEAANRICRAIGNSLLVKSSWYGCDPNWGRLMCAAGYSQTGVVEEKTDLFYDDVPVLIAGTPVWDNRDQWKAIVSRRSFSIRINVHLGNASAELLASDLSEAYVNFNKSE